MAQITYKTSGVCSRSIDIETDGDIITSITFNGGCAGNTKGVATLCIGRPIDEVISLLKGIKCGFKGTSCPDQLARALETLKNT